jgi:DNA-binding NarL/FixJ family response regulator
MNLVQEGCKLSTHSHIKVMIVDDHTIMREGLKEIMDRAGDFTVVAEAGDGAQAVESAMNARPDVVIMNIDMPLKGGIDACREIKDQLPDTRVLMLTGSSDDDSVIRSVAAGATGFLEKFCGREKFLSTLRDVADGEFRVPAETMRRVFSNVRYRSQEAESADLGGLTPREREILALFAQGMSYSEIAEVKGNRPLTVRNAIYAIQNKLRVKTKQELVVRAVRSGLLDE